MINKRLLLSILFIFSFAFVAHAQNLQVASAIHTKYAINSQVLGEERTILVRVPVDYERRQDQKYPVVYMLDAHPPQNSMMTGIIEQQAWGGQMPEMILVGIQNTNRGRDMTPTKIEDGRGASGGADKFLQFIETEVIPLIEKNYRTHPFRIFAGHSLGGLLAVYSFVARPDLFNAYIAASPVLQWDDNFVVKRAEELFRQKKDWKKTMFVAVGNEPDNMKGFNAFKDLLKKTNPNDFEYEFRVFQDENHASVVLPAYYSGLRKIFAGWTPPQNGSVADLENHYKKLSERFNYKIPIPEATLNQIGNQFLRAGDFVGAIEVFRKNVEHHPYAANCYYRLAEAYEKNGQLKQAKENYEKAFKLAEAHGEQELAKSAKANFDRVSEKMK
jgi:predicted alpha/beta superfamily hydrolase